MQNAYISLSFDDGRIDNHSVAYPILKKYNLPATFNITTGYVEGKFDKGRLTNAAPMTVDMVKELYDDTLMEIAGHGYWHSNTVEDITHGITTLRTYLGDAAKKRIRGFASPGTNLSLDYYHANKQELKAQGIDYVRLSLRYKRFPLLKTYIRKASRVVSLPWLYRLAYQDTLMDSITDDILYSIPVLSCISVGELKAVINYAVKKRQACVLMLHSIVADDSITDNWDYPASQFDKLCSFLANMQQQDKLQVLTSNDVYHRLKDR